VDTQESALLNQLRVSRYGQAEASRGPGFKLRPFPPDQSGGASPGKIKNAILLGKEGGELRLRIVYGRRRPVGEPDGKGLGEAGINADLLARLLTGKGRLRASTASERRDAIQAVEGVTWALFDKLRVRLERLERRRDLSRSEKNALIDAVTSVVGGAVVSNWS